MCKIVKSKTLMFFIVMMLSLTVQAGAATIYSTGDNGNTLITIDTTTGAATLVGALGVGFVGYAAAFTPDGTLWTMMYPSNAQLATVDILTGLATPVGTPMSTGNVIALEADSAGTLYVGGEDGSFYTVNQTTGQLTLVGAMGTVNYYV